MRHIFRLQQFIKKLWSNRVYLLLMLSDREPLICLCNFLTDTIAPSWLQTQRMTLSLKDLDLASVISSFLSNFEAAYKNCYLINLIVKNQSFFVIFVKENIYVFLTFGYRWCILRKMYVPKLFVVLFFLL